MCKQAAYLKRQREAAVLAAAVSRIGQSRRQSAARPLRDVDRSMPEGHDEIARTQNRLRVAEPAGRLNRASQRAYEPYEQPKELGRARIAGTASAGFQ